MLSNRLMKKRAVIIRTPGARNQFGEWVPGVPVEVEARCASQPNTGKDRVLEGEGSRITASRFWWFGPGTDISIGADSHTADLLRYGGEVFRVIEIQKWPDSHLRVVGVLVDPQPGGGS